MWRERRWVDLLNLIDHLPGDSYFAEALAEDEELAEAIINQGNAGEYRIRVSQWSPERAALANVEDCVRQLTHALVALNGGSPGQFSPAKRPETALDRVRRRLRISAQRDLLARLGIN